MDLFQVTGERFELNVPLKKYNEATGEFEAWATVEELDKSGEIIDLDKSWPYFVAHSDRFAQATGGESFGNVREQHDAKRAAGKLTAAPEIRMHESGNRGVYIKGVAVDPVTKSKLASRVLVGVSIGGSYVEKAAADEVRKGAKRYVANPAEYSLVDNPCVDNAMVTVVKADGSETIEKAVGFAPAQFWSCRGGNVHGHLTKATARDCDGTGGAPDTTAVSKSLWSIANLATAIAALLGVASGSEWEAFYESDAEDKAEASNIRTIAQQLFDALTAMVADEKLDAADPAMALAAVSGQLQKSATAKQLIKSLRVPSGNGSTSHSPKEGNEMDSKELSKAVSAALAPIAKALDVPDDSTDPIGEIAKAIGDLKHGSRAANLAPVVPPAADLSKDATDAITKAVASGLSGIIAKVEVLEKATEQNQTILVKMFGTPAPATAVVRESVPVEKANDGKPASAPDAKPDPNAAMVKVLSAGPREFGIQ